MSSSTNHNAKKPGRIGLKEGLKIAAPALGVLMLTSCARVSAEGSTNLVGTAVSLPAADAHSLLKIPNGDLGIKLKNGENFTDASISLLRAEGGNTSSTAGQQAYNALASDLQNYQGDDPWPNAYYYAIVQPSTQIKDPAALKANPNITFVPGK